jgi:predicted nucleotidyltransferase
MRGSYSTNKIITAMDKREYIIDKVRDYKKLVDAAFPVKIDQCYLFGSHAKGTTRKDSDIDVALVVEQLNDDYDFLKTTPILWKLTREVDDRIEPILIARDTDYAGFIDEIQRTGILINN